MNARLFISLAALCVASSAIAAGADLGQAEKQATNWTAITMFGVFVAATMFITKWAAAKTKSAADFYTGGGGITGGGCGRNRRIAVQRGGNFFRQRLQVLRHVLQGGGVLRLPLGREQQTDEVRQRRRFLPV